METSLLTWIIFTPMIFGLCIARLLPLKPKLLLLDEPYDPSGGSRQD
jgi:ABC-type taurine transport system ATPase subunit